MTCGPVLALGKVYGDARDAASYGSALITACLSGSQVLEAFAAMPSHFFLKLLQPWVLFQPFLILWRCSPYFIRLQALNLHGVVYLPKLLVVPFKGGVFDA